jgi:hypothetical protein
MQDKEKANEFQAITILFCYLMVLTLSITSTLKMETECSSETALSIGVCIVISEKTVSSTARLRKRVDDGLRACSVRASEVFGLWAVTFGVRLVVGRGPPVYNLIRIRLEGLRYDTAIKSLLLFFGYLESSTTYREVCRIWNACLIFLCDFRLKHFFDPMNI